MDKKIAIVTGGAQGIGKATVRAFLEQGYGVVFADHDEDAGKETARQYADLGAVRFVCADVSDPEQAARVVDDAIKNFTRIDVLVNNAGIFTRAPLKELGIAEWRRVIGVNLDAAFYFSRAAVEHLRRTRGAIVNIASTRALMSEADTEAYAASKGGLVALTHALAISLGPEVRVNCISPGWIDVSSWKRSGIAGDAILREIDHLQHPVGRVGMPEDVARMVLFLGSAEAAFITGQNFVIDGGMTRKMIYAE